MKTKAMERAQARRRRAGGEGEADYASIYSWMLRHADEHVDPRTGELNCTALVEAWDIECNPSHVPVGEHHIAWDIAIEVQNELTGDEES